MASNERKIRGVIVRYYSGICLERLRKTTTTKTSVGIAGTSRIRRRVDHSTTTFRDKYFIAVESITKESFIIVSLDAFLKWSLCFTFGLTFKSLFNIL
jgi:hypothetical protein